MSTEELKTKVCGFIFLKVDLGKEKEIIGRLFRFPEVKEVHEITGLNDLLVVVEFEHDVLAILNPSQRIADFVTEKIRKIHYIKDTETIIPTRTIRRSLG